MDERTQTNLLRRQEQMFRREPQRTEFCSGCDHGVVGGRVCEICGGRGYVSPDEEIGDFYDPKDNGNQGS